MKRFLKLRQMVAHGLVVLVTVSGASVCWGQSGTNVATESRSQLSPQAERALAAANQASVNEFTRAERELRDVFRATRNSAALKKFVDESLGFFEKLKQLQNLALNPVANETRIATMFREHVMDETAVCYLLEQSLADFCQKLDEQDQALLIALKIDREATRTSLSRMVIDPATYQRPIAAAVQSTVRAVKNDIARTMATFVASEAIGAGVKRAARDLGVLPGNSGSASDFVAGLLIDIGVSMAVDAATDPTKKMVSDLEIRLVNVEREILDGTVAAPGIVARLRQITKDRTAARRQLITAELSN